MGHCTFLNCSILHKPVFNDYARLKSYTQEGRCILPQSYIVYNINIKGLCAGIWRALST